LTVDSSLKEEELMFYLCLAFAIIVPYLICSINPAIIAAKIKSGRDIREMGSGNPGLTNTLRTMGKRAAAVVLLFDVLKGVISIVLVLILSSTVNCQPSTVNCQLSIVNCLVWVASLTSVLGHCYPLYYKFKGGKAVLVTVATLFVIDWLSALIALSLFILIVLVTKYVSVGSIIAAALYPVVVGVIGYYVWGNDEVYIGVIFSSVIAVLLIFKHRENMKRLIAGNEKKFGKKETS